MDERLKAQRARFDEQLARFQAGQEALRPKYPDPGPAPGPLTSEQIKQARDRQLKYREDARRDSERRIREQDR